MAEPLLTSRQRHALLYLTNEKGAKDEDVQDARAILDVLYYVGFANLEPGSNFWYATEDGMRWLLKYREEQQLFSETDKAIKRGVALYARANDLSEKLLDAAEKEL